MNGRLTLEARLFSKAFSDCYKVYQNYYTETDRSNYTGENMMRIIIDMDRKYAAFLIELLDKIGRCGHEERPFILEELRSVMGELMFDNDLLQSGYEKIGSDIAKETEEEAEVRAVCNLIEALHCTSLWFTFEGEYGLNVDNLVSLLESLNEYITGWSKRNPGDINPKNDENTGGSADETTGSISPVTDNRMTKSPITRDGIKWLFSTLRQRGVFKSDLPDTELSDVIGQLTGFSAEQVRQCNLSTEDGKNKVKELLEGLIKELDKIVTRR